MVVQANAEDSTEVDLSSFAMPFTAEVWGLLILLLFVNGVVFFWFQAKTLDNENKGIHHRFWHYILTSYGEYVNVANLEPECLELKLLQVGTGFGIVVLAASYTAGLASGLVATTKNATPWSSIDDAAAAGASICIQQGTAQFAYVDQFHPKIRLVSTPSVGITGLVGNLCSGAVVASSEYDTYSGNSLYNDRCRLRKVRKSPNCNMIIII